MSRLEQRLATPQVGKHSVDGIGDDDDVEVAALRLVQAGEHQPVDVGRLELEEGGGLEVLGLRPRHMGGEVDTGVALGEPAEDLGE